MLMHHIVSFAVAGIRNNLCFPLCYIGGFAPLRDKFLPL
jgi:hypothetical protein